MHCVRKFTVVLLSTIFLTLIASFVQSVVAVPIIWIAPTQLTDEPGNGIFTDSGGGVNLITTNQEPKWHVNLQLTLRTGDGQLISITESAGSAAYIPHKITDDVFDTLMGEKEIITIDDIKYEKVQYTYTPTFEHRFMGLYPIFSEVPMKFESTPEALAQMQMNKEYAMWKIHYCGNFEGHGYDCIPVFQDLVPTMTLEPRDVITHQWTILRILN